MSISVQAMRSVKLVDDSVCLGVQRGWLVLANGVRLEVIAIDGILYVYRDGEMVFSD